MQVAVVGVMEALPDDWYFRQMFAGSHNLAFQWPEATTLEAAVLFPAEETLKEEMKSVALKRKPGEAQDVEKWILNDQSIHFLSVIETCLKSYLRTVS